MQVTHLVGVFKLAWAPLLALDAAGVVDQNLHSVIPLLAGLSTNVASSSTLLKRELDNFVLEKLDCSLGELVVNLDDNSEKSPTSFEQWLSAFPSSVLSNMELSKVRNLFVHFLLLAKIKIKINLVHCSG